MTLPLATIERIMRNAGAEHLSEGAIAEMRDSAQEIADEVAQDAVHLVQEDGRSTVEAQDIRNAIEH